MRYGRRQNKHVVYQQKPNIRWNEPNRYQVPHIYLVKRILDSVPNFSKNDFVLTKCIMILARAAVFLNLSTMLWAYFGTIVCSMWHMYPESFLLGYFSETRLLLQEFFIIKSLQRNKNHQSLVVRIYHGLQQGWTLMLASYGTLLVALRTDYDWYKARIFYKHDKSTERTCKNTCSRFMQAKNLGLKYTSTWKIGCNCRVVGHCELENLLCFKQISFVGYCF